SPLNCCAVVSSGVMLCTHVGAHENTAQRPMSMEPKITEPCRRFLRYMGENNLRVFIPSLLCSPFLFQLSDSARKGADTNASTTGTSPMRKAFCHSERKLFIAPAAINPTGIAAETIPNATA